jgi:hypothetical protein
MIKYFYSLSFLLLILFFIYGCDNNVDTNKAEPADHFQVDLQTWFSNVNVKVSIDNSIVFNDTVTTGSILAYAAIIPIDINKGTHSLKVTVENSITNESTFTINDTLYVGVHYSATNSNVTFDKRLNADRLFSSADLGREIRIIAIIVL